MALLRKLFARKAMDGLSCISERVYVFNSCFSDEPLLDEGAYRDYLTSTVIQLRSGHPHDAALMLLNFTAAPGRRRSPAVDSLLQYGVAAVADYPCRYACSPSLPLARTAALLGACVDWLVSGRQRNVLLVHCEGGDVAGEAWPALALAVASLLVYMEEAGAQEGQEEAVLAAVYGRAPAALLAAGLGLDPRPSHLRYLRYVTRLKGSSSFKGMRREPLLVLDCLILRAVPDFDGDGGCRPLVRVHGRRPHSGHLDDDASPSPKMLFTTAKIKQYNQAKSTVIKANIECQVQGDVAIECAHVGEDSADHEDAMFRVMFNTCFVESNMMVLTIDDIDLPWNCSREKFQKGFKIEVFFSEVELSDSEIDSPTVEMLGGDRHDGVAEEFYDFEEILISSDLNSKDHEWHGKTSRQDRNQEPDSKPLSKGERKPSGLETSTASGSSEEDGSTGTDDEVEFIRESDVNTEIKDSLEETGNPQDGSRSAIQPIFLANKDPNPEITHVPEGITHQVDEISMQEGATSTSSIINEVNHSNMARTGDLINPLPKKRSRQDLGKQAAIIPPLATIKKTRKPYNGSDDKKTSKGKMLLKQTLQKGFLIATSSCKSSSASQASAVITPHRKHEKENKLKHGPAQATITPALSKGHSKHSTSHHAGGGPVAAKEDELKPATFTIGTEIPPSPPSPPSQEELNQQGSKGGQETAVESSPTHAPVNSGTRKAPKQEVTMASVEAPAPGRPMVLKKSLSSPAISQTRGATTTSSVKRSNITTLPVPGVKPKVISSSPRARPSPSPPRRSPLVSSKDKRAVPTAQAATKPGTSTAGRMPRRASFSELPSSVSSTNGRSLSPRTSRVTTSHPIGAKESGRSLSPLSPRSPRGQPSSTTSTLTVGRMPHHASFGELPSSLSSTNGLSLSPRTIRVTTSRPIGVKESGRSLSPLSPRSPRAQPSSTTSTSIATTSGSRYSNHSSTSAGFGATSTSRPRGSGAVPAKPTRFSS